MDHEVHLMLLKVCVHRIQLSVRFPCSLTFQLKVDNKTIDCRGTYELVKGACSPEEMLRLEVELEKREDETFREKQAKIIIYMTSANGKIPAGSATLSLANVKSGASETRNTGIEKCPDKSASINFTFSLDYLRTITKSASNHKSGLMYGKLEQSHISSASRIRYSGSPQFQNIRSSGDKYSKPSHQRKSSNHSSTYQIMTKNVVERDFEYDQKRSSRVSGLMDGEETPNRIVSIEKQKSQQMKQLSRLQRELSRKNLEDKTQSEEHYNRIKNELNEVIAENDGLREKVRTFERRDKEQVQTIKELRDEIERKKQKTYQQEFIRMQSQSILDQKQKIVKEMQAQLKQYEQEINDLKIAMSTQQKRIEFREISLKDQLTKLNQKYQVSEVERQKAIVELNGMLEELEASEKKHQLVIKEKDKVQAEEKNKLVKRAENLTRTIDQQREELDERSTEIMDLQREIKSLQGKLNELQTECSETKIEGKNIGYELEKQRERGRNFQKELEKAHEMQKQFNDLKKRYQELQQTNQNTKKTLQSSNRQSQQLQTKLKQFQQQLASKSQQISSLMTKIFNLNAQIDSFKKEQQNYSKEAETLSMNNLNAVNKIEELRMKLDQLQFSYNELESQSEEQIAYMIKTKQYIEAQLEETRWNCEKYKESCEEMSARNKAISAEILEFNRKIMELEDRNAKYEQQLADAKSTIAVGIQEKEMQANKQKDLQQKLKQKNDQIYELNKKVSKTERELFMVSQKLKHTQKFYSQKLQSEQGQHKNKDSRLNETIQNLNKLQIELIAKEQQISSLLSTQTKLNIECEYMKQQLKAAKKDNGELEERVGQLEEDLIGVNDRLVTLGQSLEKEVALKLRISQDLAKRSKEFEDFRAANYAALDLLLQEIGKDLGSGTTETNLLSFPDQKYSALQVQAIKKRNTLLSKYQQQIRSLETHLKNNEQQILKLKKHHSEREEELEALLQNQKSKLKNTHSDLSLEKQELIERINGLEDRIFELTAEGEKLNIQNEENKLAIIDSQNLINELNFQIDNYRNQIKTLQSSVKNLKDENSKIKLSYENSLMSSSEESAVQIDKLKKMLTESERKMQGLEKTIGEKEQIIVKLENGLENSGHQKEKVEQKLQELTNRWTQLTQERKNGIENERNAQKAIKKLQEKVSGLEQQLNQQAKRLNQSAIDRKKLQDALSQEQIAKEKLIGELELTHEHISELENMLKDTGDKTKKVAERSTVQIKKLKEEIVALNSNIELKTFEISQHQNTIKSLKAANQELSQQLQSRKQQLIGLQLSAEQSKAHTIQIAQQLESTLSQKQSLQIEVKALKETMINLEELLNENQSNMDTMVLKDREITRLKEEISGKDRAYEKTLQDLKTQLNQGKKELTTRVQREEEYKKRIRELESQIQNHLYDAESEKKGWEESADNERKKLLYELQGVKEQNKLLAEQFQFQREQMNHQLDQAAEQITHLKQIISESEMHIENTSAYSAEQIEKIKSLEAQLKSCKQEWQREKMAYIPTQKQMKEIENEITKYQKYAIELEKKNKQLTELAKKRLAEQQKSSCGDLLREINTILLRNKSKIISRVGEREREQVIADFKQIHQKLEGAIKSYHLLK